MCRHERVVEERAGPQRRQPRQLAGGVVQGSDDGQRPGPQCLPPPRCRPRRGGILQDVTRDRRRHPLGTGLANGRVTDQLHEVLCLVRERRRDRDDDRLVRLAAGCRVALAGLLLETRVQRVLDDRRPHVAGRHEPELERDVFGDGSAVEDEPGASIDVIGPHRLGIGEGVDEQRPRRVGQCCRCPAAGWRQHAAGAGTLGRHQRGREQTAALEARRRTGRVRKDADVEPLFLGCGRGHEALDDDDRGVRRVQQRLRGQRSPATGLAADSAAGRHGDHVSPNSRWDVAGAGAPEAHDQPVAVHDDRFVSVEHGLGRDRPLQDRGNLDPVGDGNPFRCGGAVGPLDTRAAPQPDR